MLNLIKWLATMQVVTAATASRECHPQGPIFPRPRNLTNSATFKLALAKLTYVLDAAVQGNIKAGWDTRNVSMSIGLVSLGQDEPSVPAWEYHHLASGNVNGTKLLDRNSLYLIGSVSKVITDAIFLRSGVNADDPITKYLPSLNDPTSEVSWKDITLKSLAAQLSGIPPNYGFSEYYYLHQYFEYLGFPPLNATSAYANCSITGLNNACSRSEFLTGIIRHLHPVSPPNARPVYSNIAYTLLVYAIQIFTDVPSYAQLLHDLISAPLNLSSTFPSGSPQINDSLAVIPPVYNNWGGDYGDHTPGGGLVSSLSDLSSFLHSILAHKIFSSETAVRAWLQPHSFSGSENSFVGMPWEIFRPPPELLFPNNEKGRHTVTINAKDGAAYGYRARIAVIDEYGVGVVVLTAGDIDALGSVYDAVLSTLLPAIDDVAREETTLEYVGTFVSNHTKNGTEAGGVMTATVNMMDDGSSLQLTNLNRNGKDMLKAMKDIWAVTLGVFLPALNAETTWRIYPAEVVTAATDGDGGDDWKKEVVREDWRIWWDVKPADAETELPFLRTELMKKVKSL